MVKRRIRVARRLRKGGIRSKVRKISGFTEPSSANEAAFNRAVKEVEKASARLLDSLVTAAPPRSRAVEAAEAHANAVRRFGSGEGT